MVLFTLISRLSDALPLVRPRRCSSSAAPCGARAAVLLPPLTHSPVALSPPTLTHPPTIPPPPPPQVASTDASTGATSASGSGPTSRDLEEHKQQGKAIVKRLDTRSPSRMSIDSGQLAYKCVGGAAGVGVP